MMTGNYFWRLYDYGTQAYKLGYSYQDLSD
jgi:hypothetical protein